MSRSASLLVLVLTQVQSIQAAQILSSQQQRMQSNPPHPPPPRPYSNSNPQPYNPPQPQLQYQSRPPPPLPNQAQQLQTQVPPRLSPNNSYNNTQFSQNAASSHIPQYYGFGPPPQVHHGRPPPPSRPPGTPAPGSSSADASLFPLFKAVDTAGAGQLTERELGKALVNGDFTSFDPHTVKMMIRMFDADKDGSISFEEFWYTRLLCSCITGPS